ncbi:MAG: MmgE/PrpD family protein [Candidatus Sumerlaeia bacterium]|nr:MmgE/PrpD family protein [Candidatus Sumerlaeia bacterium]
MAQSTASNEPTITAHISQWASRLRYEDISRDAVDAAKRFLYDSVGCALGGVQHEDCQQAERVVLALGGEPSCTLIGSGKKTNVDYSALFNALAIRAMDFNDIYWRQDPCHPSDIIPAATSPCELLGKGGKELIVGIILAYEFEMRLCEAAFPGVRERGWHHATLTAFASPIVAARMLDLDWRQMQNAIGIAGSHCHTLGAVTAGKLTNMKNTVDPMATQAGVFAALLAREGYSGPEHVIDGKEGMVKVLGPEWKLNILTDGLGESWRILDCGMKAFPIEALCHAPLSAVLKICKEHHLAADDIQEIELQCIARAADILTDPAKYAPKTRETADHSLPYCIAAGIIWGKVTPEEFKESAIRDPRIQQHIHKFKAKANPEFEPLFPAKQPNHVTITTTKGEKFELRVDYPKGDPRDPMTMEEIETKFHSLAAPIVSEKRRNQIKDAINHLEDIENTGELMGLMVRDI